MTLPVFSQQPPDSLLRYLEIAAGNNPTVNQRFYEYKAALQKIPQAGSLPDPDFSAGLFLKPMELVNGNQIADLRLMQMFPWFGVLRSAKDEMSLMADSKFEIFRDSKLQVYYDVQRSWYDLFKVRKEIAVSEKNLEILKTIERLATVKFQSASYSNSSGGSGSPGTISGGSAGAGAGVSSGMQNMGATASSNTISNQMQSSQGMQSRSMDPGSGSSGLADLYRIQMESGELRNKISELMNQLKSITAEFNGFLNRPPDTPVFTPDSFSSDSLPRLLISATDSMLKNNPMLTMLDYEKRSLTARKKMVKSMGYPMMGLGINYSITGKNAMSASSMNGSDMIMPMVSVTLPVYRKKYKAMAAETDLLTVATSYNYTAAVNALQTEYYQALQQYKDATGRIRLYDEQVQLATKSLEIFLKSFAASNASLTDLLRIRQQTFDYELKRAEAQSDLNKSAAQIMRLTASSKF